MQGQISFLSTVSPELLKGYTVEFFTSVTSTESAVALKMEAIAKARGISAAVHRHSHGPPGAPAAPLPSKGTAALRL